jgi:glyoxylase-like metal-dependent hydrolase (beta-lactamase superfamily II)
MMQEPYQASPDVYVLPTHLALPGVGNIPINAFVLLAEEPLLIDAGLGIDGPEFLAAVDSIVPLRELRWIWLTHDDADHIGSLQRVMELAPQARLATHGQGALRMSTWWPVPLHRVHAISTEDRLHVGDRNLLAIRPPVFDNPTSTGIFDESTGALFSVDSFGAILPELTQDAADIPREDLTNGMVAWATFDVPWIHLVDQDRFERVLDAVRALQPSRVLSSHLPSATGSIEAFLKVLRSLRDAEPYVAPGKEAFDEMIRGLERPASG